MNKPITHLLIGVWLLFATIGLAQTPTFTISPTSVTKAIGASFAVDVKVRHEQ